MANVLFPTTNAQKVQNIWNRDQGIIDEGTFFLATNPTPGTGIATTTSITTEDQLHPVMLIQNTWTPGDPNAKNIYPINLEMIWTAAPTSATFWQYSLRLDTSNPNKYTSGGSVIVPVNANGQVNTGSRAAIYFGAIVGLTQASSGRLVDIGMAHQTIPTVRDTTRLQFGVPHINAVNNATGVNVNRSVSVPPLVIAPGQWMALQMWGTANAAAPAWEFILQYVER